MIIIYALIILGCKQYPDQRLEFNAYEVEFDSFKWDSIPYKFTSYIQDSILEKKGNHFAAWESSYIGDVNSALNYFDINASSSSNIPSSIMIFGEYTRKDAIPFIIAEAENTDIVIINEAHHSSQHRVFTARLLKKLFKIGYRNLGLETYFDSIKNDSILSKNKYPVLQSGFYIREPQFGILVREALHLGFNVFGYESSGHQNGKEREINQANNIAEYLRENPKGKTVIHCGFDHVLEGQTSGAWEKSMSGRLSETLNIDPLTIDQVTFSERSQKRYEHPFYQLTNVDYPSIYIDDNGNIINKERNEFWVDISVFHPRSKNETRPKWLLYDKRKVYTLALPESKLTLPILVYAYIDQEEIGVAVPYDVQEAKDDFFVKLVLEKGEYYKVIALSQSNQSYLSYYHAN